MADYTISPGTEDWDVPLNSNMADVNSRLTTLENQPGGETFVSAPLESPPTSGTSLWRIT